MQYLITEGTDAAASFSMGYDFEKAVERISLLFQVEKDYVTERGRQNERVRGAGIYLSIGLVFDRFQTACLRSSAITLAELKA